MGSGATERADQGEQHVLGVRCLDVLAGTTRRSLGTMTTNLMDGGVRSREAANRPGICGRDVYRLLFAGASILGPAATGRCTSTRRRIEAYLGRHSYGVVAEPSTGSS